MFENHDRGLLLLQVDAYAQLRDRFGLVDYPASSLPLTVIVCLPEIENR